MLSLDTNILVYSADNTAGVRHSVAKQVVDRAAASGAVLIEQSLFEFFHACTRKHKMTAFEATSVVQRLIHDFLVIHPHENALQDSFAVQAHYGLSIWDARLLSVCESYGCDHLLSEDLQDGAQYGAVAIINPFNPANANLLERLLS